MINKEKLLTGWAVAKNILLAVLVVALMIATCIAASRTYNFFTNGLFANTGEEYYLPRKEFTIPPAYAYIDDGDDGVG